MNWKRKPRKLTAEQKAKRTENKKRWYHANKERVALRTAASRAKHRTWHNAYYHARKNDPIFRLKRLLRVRIYTALKGKTKTGSAVQLLGCSLEMLKTHIEQTFKAGMTWDNHGKTGWHIDHIKPLAKFDLTDPIQLAQACHYTNLQALWAKENIAKKDNY